MIGEVYCDVTEVRALKPNKSVESIMIVDIFIIQPRPGIFICLENMR